MTDNQPQQSKYPHEVLRDLLKKHFFKMFGIITIWFSGGLFAGYSYNVGVGHYWLESTMIFLVGMFYMFYSEDEQKQAAGKEP